MAWTVSSHRAPDNNKWLHISVYDGVHAFALAAKTSHIDVDALLFDLAAFAHLRLDTVHVRDAKRIYFSFVRQPASGTSASVVQCIARWTYAHGSLLAHDPAGAPLAFYNLPAANTTALCRAIVESVFSFK